MESIAPGYHPPPSYREEILRRLPRTLVLLAVATGRQGNPQGVARATEPVRLPLSRLPSPPPPVSPERKREVDRVVAEIPGQGGLQVRGGPRGGG